MPRKTPAEKLDTPTVLAQEEAAEGFEEPEMELASLETASPVSTSEVQGPLARQLQTMMVFLHNISGDITSLKANMNSIDSRLAAVESHKIRTDDQNHGIPVSTTETKHGNTRYDTRSLS